MHPLFARDGQRRIALDRAAGSTAGDAREGDLFPRLLKAARAWLESAEGRTATHLASNDYREDRGPLDPAFIVLLRRWLLEAPEHADVGPFAAVVAGELGATAVLVELLGLVTSPNPFVAAVAIGAGRKLGAGMRAGKVRVVAQFLPESTVAAIEAWGDEPTVS